MLWHKAWLETRARFVTGLVILVILALGTVLGYPTVRMLPLNQAPLAPGAVGRAIQQAIELARTFQGYVYQQWFTQNLPQTATLFAVIIGSGSVYTQSRGALYTLSLPASRAEVLQARAITGLWQLLVLAFVPSLVIAALAPAIGESQNVVTCCCTVSRSSWASRCSSAWRCCSPRCSPACGPDSHHLRHLLRRVLHRSGACPLRKPAVWHLQDDARRRALHGRHRAVDLDGS